MKQLNVTIPDPSNTRHPGANGNKDIIPSSNTFLKNFLDLLRKIFVYDPEHRITAKAALQHPWFKEPPHPDDGTEAAKIRLERMRSEQELAGARLPGMHP